MHVWASCHMFPLPTMHLVLCLSCRSAASVTSLAEFCTGMGVVKLRNASSVCCSSVSGNFREEPEVMPSLPPDGDSGSGFDQFSFAAGANRRLGNGSRNPRCLEQALKSHAEPTASPVSRRSFSSLSSSYTK